jgi:hypothetical protein
MQIHSALRNMLLAATLLSAPAFSYAQISIGISITTAPPVLPVYEQPPCPAPNYIWTPGYWAWGDDDYYWVPGTWVLAPQPGYLWTPGYWGYELSGIYLWHAGYWGPQVGFYGGVNYGFGYTGNGFYGGEWRGRDFAYNTAVVNVDRTVIRNTYMNNTTIVNNYNRASFNGGPHGIAMQPTPQQRAFASERHFQPTPMQLQHEQVARQDRANFASINHGMPAHAAVARPVSNVTQLTRAAIPARAAAPTNNAWPGTPVAVHPGNTLQKTARPTDTFARPNYETRPAIASRPQPVAQPSLNAAPTNANRPAPVARPQTKLRPSPVQQPSMAPLPQPVQRPNVNAASANNYHPAPVARPQSMNEPIQQRPQWQNQSRPAPQMRQQPPVMQQAPRAPQPAYHPAPAPPPAPVQQQHESTPRPENRPHQ